MVIWPFGPHRLAHGPKYVGQLMGQSGMHGVETTAAVPSKLGNVYLCTVIILATWMH